MARPVVLIGKKFFTFLVPHKNFKGLFDLKIMKAADEEDAFEKMGKKHKEFLFIEVKGVGM